MATQDGFSGNLGKIDLQRLLQDWAAGGRTGTVNIDHPVFPSTLWLRQGDIVDARSGDLEGLAAAYRSLSLKEGLVQFSEHADNRTRTIADSLAALFGRDHCMSSDWASVPRNAPALYARLRARPGYVETTGAQLDAEPRRLLQALNGERSVVDALEIAKGNAGALLRQLADWVERGVVESSPSSDSLRRVSSNPPRTGTSSVPPGGKGTLVGMPAIRAVDITPTLVRGESGPDTNRGLQREEFRSSAPPQAESDTTGSKSPGGARSSPEHVPTTERVARSQSSIPAAGTAPQSPVPSPRATPVPLPPPLSPIPARSMTPSPSPLPVRRETPPPTPAPLVRPTPHPQPIPGVGSGTLARSSPMPHGYPTPTPVVTGAHTAALAGATLTGGALRNPVPTGLTPDAGLPSSTPPPGPARTSSSAEAIAPQGTVIVAAVNLDDGGPASARLNRAIETDPTSATLGRYRVVQRIGRGGMGTVYRAHLLGDSGFTRPVAIKVLRSQLAKSDSALKMLLKEANIASLVQHRNVVSVIDVGTADGQPYLVMDYVQGHSLAALLKKAPREATPERIVSILLDCLSGLEAIHNVADENGRMLGVVHNDLSPENILVGMDGTSRVADLGVASLRRDAAGPQRGKPGHLSPERVRGGSFDRRSDLFSLGIVMWNALTGQELFRGASAEETMRSVLSTTVPRPSTIGNRPPAALDTVCLRALARDPYARYASAEEMLIDLRRVAVANDILAPPSSVGAWARLVSVAPDAPEGASGPRSPDAPAPFGSTHRAGPGATSDSGPPDAAGIETNPRPNLPSVSPADTRPLPTLGQTTPAWRIVKGVAALAAVGLLAYVAMEPGLGAKPPPVEVTIPRTAPHSNMPTHDEAVPDPVEFPPPVRSVSPATADEPRTAAPASKRRAPATPSAGVTAVESNPYDSVARETRPSAPKVQAVRTLPSAPAPRSAAPGK